MRVSQPASLLGRIEAWWSWYLALAAVNATGRARTDRPLKVIYCLDTSDIIEYVLPRSFQEFRYPTRLDLATKAMMSSGRELFILPPHARELARLQRNWRERVRMALVKMDNIYRDMADSRATFSPLFATDDEIYEPLVEALLREGPKAFGSWFGPVEGIEKTMRSIGERISVFHLPSEAAAASWDYQMDYNTVEAWFDKLQRTQPSHVLPARHLVDAIALDMVAAVNRELPDDTVAVLITHSPKILRFLNPYESLWNEFSRRRVPMVQSTEVFLADELQRQMDSPWLQEEESRLKSLMDMRGRVSAASADLAEQPFAALVEHCENEVARLEEVSGNWQVLERVRLEADHPEESGAFAAFRDAIVSSNREQLKTVLRDRLDELRAEMSSLLGSLGTSFVPVPGDEFAAMDPVASSTSPLDRTRTLVRSGIGANVHTFRITGLEAQRKLQSILALLHAAPAKGRTTKRDHLTDIQRQLFECERESGEHPEYYVLLASVFFSRGLWFETYDIALQGQEQLARSGRAMDGNAERDAVHLELMFVAAASFHSWTLRDFGDLPNLAGRLQRVLKMCCEAVAARPANLPMDPRHLREIAAVFGEASFQQLVLTLDGCESRIFEVAGDLRDMRHLFRAFADAAVRLCEPNDVLRSYYLNTSLYALTEEDEPTTVRARRVIAEQLVAMEGLDANAQDTLGWHHLTLARRETGDTRRRMLQEARKYAELAVKDGEPGNRFYQRLFGSHLAEVNREIEQLGKAPPQ